jgi:hypothetical protein
MRAKSQIGLVNVVAFYTLKKMQVNILLNFKVFADNHFRCKKYLMNK